jgi:hypothetical protein
LTDRFCEELEKLLNHAYEAGVNSEHVVHVLRRQARAYALRQKRAFDERRERRRFPR